MACILQVQELLNSCSIAAALSGSENGLGIPLNAFHGQMGCIYLFEDILSPGIGLYLSRRFMHHHSSFTSFMYCCT